MKRVKIAVIVAGLTILGAAAAYAEGCRNGEVWCCKKTSSGATSCSCTIFCS